MVGSNGQVDSATRLVIFDAPRDAPLRTSLSSSHPYLTFDWQTAWSPPSVAGPIRTVPAWHWVSSAPELAKHARYLLHQWVYPLIAGGQGYCVAFSFGAAEFERPELDPGSMEHLDFEDIGTLLCADAVRVSLGSLPQLAGRMTLTPIEEKLAAALDEAGLTYRAQAKVGDFRVDFLLEPNGHKIAVEADGRAYHDPESDRQRDDALKGLGISDVIHFTGSRIHRDPDACAADVQKALSGMRTVPARTTTDPLDPSQMKAAVHRTGAARVLAPAGSGKTRTMVNRVVELVRRGVDPGSILVLAFNRKAAEQVIPKLTELGVPCVRKIRPEHPGVHVATFNAFGYRYQKEVIGARPRLAEDSASWHRLMGQAVRDAGVDVGSLKAKRGADPIQGFMKGLARVRADLQDPKDIEVEIESYDGTSTVVEFAPVEARFQELQLRAQVQSFDDQIYLAVRDLLATPSHRAQMQSQYEHVLVDEYQDLNGTQLALVDMLSRPYRNLFVVGDDDQLIYGWRFAKPANILDFPQRVPPKPYSDTYTLSTNYRCSQAVVGTSQRLIAHNRTRVEKSIRHREGAPAGAVIYCRHPEWATRAEAVCGFLKSERSLTRCDWRELAVLCRYRSQQFLIAMALDRAGIPRTPLLSYRLFTHPAARLVRAYLQLVTSPSSISGESLRLLINRPNRYVKNVTVDRICGSRDPWGELGRLARPSQAGGQLVPRALQDLVRCTQELHGWLRHERPKAAEALSRVLVEFGIEEHFKDAAKPAGAQQDDAGPQQVLDAIKMLCADYPDLAAFLTEWDKLVENEAEHRDMDDDTLGRERDEDQDKVVIGTIHSAKGREYESVVILDYSSDLSKLTAEQAEEERRVLYVGVTRAKSRVLLTIDDSRGVVHPFFKEMPPPVRGGERLAVQRELDGLIQSEQDVVVERQRAREKLDRLTGGAALREAEGEFRQDGGKKRIHDLEDLVADTTRAVASAGAWAGMTGKKGKREQDLARYTRELERLQKLERQILLLKGDPEKAVASVRQRLAKAESRVAELAAHRDALESRLIELDILGIS